MLSMINKKKDTLFNKITNSLSYFGFTENKKICSYKVLYKTKFLLKENNNYITTDIYANINDIYDGILIYDNGEYYLDLGGNPISYLPIIDIKSGKILVMNV